MNQNRFVTKACIGVFLLLSCFALQGQTDHLLLITSDGIRWQEVFAGADSALLFNPRFVSDTTAYKAKYWSPDPEERRRKLMPFLWTVVQANGQLYGNRRKGSRVDISNFIRISYPGYAEILTGRVDPLIFDNHPWRDRHSNVLQHLAKTADSSGKTAAFASWSNLYMVLDAQKCTFPVNAGSNLCPIKDWRKTPPPEDSCFWSPAILHTINRHDSITWRLASEYWQCEKPSVLYISLMETDLIAHKGHYDGYLDAMHRLDSLIGDLWEKMQEDPAFRRHTALFLTTDHGRGRGGWMGNWKVHNHLTAGSQQIWFAAMSPDLNPLGEMGDGVRTKKIKATRFAQTMATLLGQNIDQKRWGRAIDLSGTNTRLTRNALLNGDLGKR